MVKGLGERSENRIERGNILGKYQFNRHFRVQSRIKTPFYQAGFFIFPFLHRVHIVRQSVGNGEFKKTGANLDSSLRRGRDEMVMPRARSSLPPQIPLSEIKLRSCQKPHEFSFALRSLIRSTRKPNLLSTAASESFNNTDDSMKFGIGSSSKNLRPQF